MNKLKFKKVIATFSALVAMTGMLLFPRLSFAQSAPTFLTGDIVTATNNTTDPSGTWSDPVNATSGQIIEFRVMAQNQTPGTTAQNVTITAAVPVQPSPNPQVTATVSADNFPSTSDTATVHLTDGMQQGFAFVPGHVRIFSSSCPSGCVGSDSLATTGINVGNLAFGESVQVTFKAGLTNVPSSTPTPPPSTPTVTPTPPTPTPSIGGIQCGQGTVSVVINGAIQCQSQSQSQTVTQTNNNNQTVTVQASAPAAAQPAAPAPKVVTVAATPVKQLPSTGLPIGGLALSGLAPVGWALRRFGKGNEDATDALPYLISKAKESKKFFS